MTKRKALNKNKLLKANPQIDKKVFAENEKKIAEAKAALGGQAADSQVVPAYGGRRIVQDDRGFVAESDDGWRVPAYG